VIRSFLAAPFQLVIILCMMIGTVAALAIFWIHNR